MGKAVKWIIGILAVTAVVVTPIIIIKNKKKENENQDSDNDTMNQSNSDTTNNTNNKQTSTAESFPLAKGMKGDNVKKLQKALGVSTDGLFGVATENALKSKYNVTTCSKDLFNYITIEVGDVVYAVNSNGINIRRGQGTSTSIISSDVKGKIGKVVEIVKGVNESGSYDGYNWCRIELANPVTYNGTKYTIGYCRIDVLTK